MDDNIVANGGRHGRGRRRRHRAGMDENEGR